MLVDLDTFDVSDIIELLYDKEQLQTKIKEAQEILNNNETNAQTNN